MIQILDSTLREGEQTPGVYFPPTQKLAIAKLLDEIGVDIIEVGNPCVDAEIAMAIKQVAKAGLKAKIAAHSLCRIENVQQVLDCGVDFLGVFFSVSEQRLKKDHNMCLEQAIAKIVEVIGYAKAENPNLIIRYTPEDTVRSPIDNIVDAATAAIKAGANIIGVADTTGYTTPFHQNRSIYFYIKTLKEELASRGLYPQIEVHCHNDRGLALANALDAYRAGADIIDVSVMGLGERAGIVDLAELLINLIDLEGEANPWQLEGIPELYDIVSQDTNIFIPPHRPVVGSNAFTHYAGVHVKAIAKDEQLYQSVNPKIFGKRSSFILGVQSGHTAVKLAMKQIGKEDLADNQDIVSKVLQEIKKVAKRGKPIDIVQELPAIVDRCSQGYL